MGPTQNRAVISLALFAILLTATGCGESEEEKELACWRKRVVVTAEIDRINAMSLREFRLIRAIPNANDSETEFFRSFETRTLRSDWNNSDCVYDPISFRAFDRMGIPEPPDN